MPRVDLQERRVVLGADEHSPGGRRGGGVRLGLAPPLLLGDLLEALLEQRRGRFGLGGDGGGAVGLGSGTLKI